MLSGFAFFIVVNKVDHVILPLGRRRMIFVGYFIKEVIHIVHCIDDFFDIGFLQGGNIGAGQCMDLESFAVLVQIAVDSVDVIVAVKGMALPGIR